MSETDVATTQSLYPALRYHDPRAAIQFLCDAFGFERNVVYDAPDGSVAHAQLVLGSGLLMLGTARDGDLVKTPRELGGVTGSVFCFVPDVDAHCARARAAGARIEREPYATDYDSREYTAYDPEGYAWAFGTYRP